MITFQSDVKDGILKQMEAQNAARGPKAVVFRRTPRAGYELQGAADGLPLQCISQAIRLYASPGKPYTHTLSVDVNVLVDTVGLPVVFFKLLERLYDYECLEPDTATKFIRGVPSNQETDGWDRELGKLLFQFFTVHNWKVMKKLSEKRVMGLFDDVMSGQITTPKILALCALAVCRDGDRLPHPILVLNFVNGYVNMLDTLGAINKS